MVYALSSAVMLLIEFALDAYVLDPLDLHSALLYAHCAERTCYFYKLITIT